MTVILRGGQGHFANNINNFGTIVAYDDAQPTAVHCTQIINFNSGIWNTTGVLISHTGIHNVGYRYFNLRSVWGANDVDSNIVYIVNHPGAAIDLVESMTVGQIQNQGSLSLWGTNTLGATLLANPGGGIENQPGGVINVNTGAIVDSGNANLQVFRDPRRTTYPRAAPEPSKSESPAPARGVQRAPSYARFSSSSQREKSCASRACVSAICWPSCASFR